MPTTCKSPKSVRRGVSTLRRVALNPVFSQPHCFLGPTGLVPHRDSLKATGIRRGSTMDTLEIFVSSFDTECLPMAVSKGFGATHS